MLLQGAPRSAQRELKTMVREAHRRGMEVILDVVFNHTAEGNELGPHISFRGIDNRRSASSPCHQFPHTFHAPDTSQANDVGTIQPPAASSV